MLWHGPQTHTVNGMINICCLMRNQPLQSYSKKGAPVQQPASTASTCPHQSRARVLAWLQAQQSLQSVGISGTNAQTLQAKATSVPARLSLHNYGASSCPHEWCTLRRALFCAVSCHRVLSLSASSMSCNVKPAARWRYISGIANISMPRVRQATHAA